METLRDALDTRRRLVEEALAGTFAELRPDVLRDAARWYPDAGGKRLRPVMALLACGAAGGPEASALPVALSVELVHNFSLVHDDIMDRDDTRRGKPTVHRRWNEAMAILAGDVLFARAFEVLGRLPRGVDGLAVTNLLSWAVRRLCEGQAMDVAFETREDVTGDEYLEMIRGKTAVLFAAACRGGALCGTGPGAADALGEFGENFGMAFQVADDLLDVQADTATLGKPWGSDLRAGKRTLLVLEARRLADGPRRRPLDAVLGRPDASDDEVTAAVEVLRESGAVAAVTAVRDAFAARAEAALEEIPESPAREHLRELNAWAVTRKS